MKKLVLSLFFGLSVLSVYGQAEIPILSAIETSSKVSQSKIIETLGKVKEHVELAKSSYEEFQKYNAIYRNISGAIEYYRKVKQYISLASSAYENAKRLQEKYRNITRESNIPIDINMLDAINQKINSAFSDAEMLITDLGTIAGLPLPGKPMPTIEMTPAERINTIQKLSEELDNNQLAKLQQINEVLEKQIQGIEDMNTHIKDIEEKYVYYQKAIEEAQENKKEMIGQLYTSRVQVSRFFYILSAIFFLLGAYAIWFKIAIEQENAGRLAVGYAIAVFSFVIIPSIIDKFYSLSNL